MIIYEDGLHIIGRIQVGNSPLLEQI
ncbi:hypothetical protein KL86PLE_100220 [uncultured Pleomorphomonas sp.]|uniref:Uncharacterized protein n=1 Tax=uncultured Pleomorphomonas sp. TaxID=442121 RepID=A0A212L1R8_9HYPH|nr:hypothetical protein KL86PLE_100220 [uncultured Pleomorphomonas sp.]